MATTQYIGSRYVPVFADPAEWNSTRTYEPLTIVMHEGNSYTSKQYVPTGIDIDNDDYWALSGNYNAQVEQYRQETKNAVAQVDVRLSENEKNVATQLSDQNTEVSNRLSENETKMDSLQSNVNKQIDELSAETQQIETNKQNIIAETNRATEAEQNLANSKTVMLSFGDSFGDEYNEWPYLLAPKFGLTCDSFNIGGDVWPWKNGLNNAIAKYNTDEMKNKIAFAVAYGGINQIVDNPLTDTTTITTFISNFNAAFPGVPLYIAPMNNCSPGNTNFPKIYSNALKSYIALMGKLRQASGNFILLNNSVWYNTGVLNSWKDDKLHPNEQGSILIANNLAMAINGTNTNVMATPVFGEHKGWNITSDCYVTGDYLVTAGAVNTQVTVNTIYNYSYGIVPLSTKEISDTRNLPKIPCDIYTKDGTFKSRFYAYYGADTSGLQNYISVEGISYDETDIVYIRPTFIPLF